MTGSVIMLLAGPLQSWGGPAAGVYERPTDTMPSLSAIIGIIANAFGRARTDPIDDIAAGAQLAVRADRPGLIIEDYHTVGTPGRYALAAESGAQLKNPVVTLRRYLCDAAFLAVYTPPPATDAQKVFEALMNPKRPLYLGRRSCPPSERIPVAVSTDQNPEHILTNAKVLRDPDPRAAGRPHRDSDFYALADTAEESVPVLIEMSAPAGHDPLKSSLRKDAPTTFDPRRLYHLDRHIVTKTLPMPVSACVGRGRPAVGALYESIGARP